MLITNNSNVPLVLASWLVDDNYDYNQDPNYVSVTTLMKPLRQQVIPKRMEPGQRSIDVQDLTASTLGTAIHDSIEKTWVTKASRDRALRLLGYPQHVIDSIVVNPTDAEVRASNSMIPVYFEQRAIRESEGYSIGGKFDMVADGIVQDNKSTSTYTWVHGTRDDEHVLQLSLYRWIDAGQPVRKISEDFGVINYIFTDWSKAQAKQNPANYPQSRVATKTLRLLSLRETEDWVRGRINLLKQHRNTPEPNLPFCTDAELWRSDPQYKFYADPSKTDGRSTKNFTDLAEANRFKAEKGKGVVITKPGEPKRCDYCPAFEACTQKDNYFRANP